MTALRGAQNCGLEGGELSQWQAASRLALYSIQWATHAKPTTIQNVRVDHRRADIRHPHNSS